MDGVTMSPVCHSAVKSTQIGWLRRPRRLAAKVYMAGGFVSICAHVGHPASPPERKKAEGRGGLQLFTRPVHNRWKVARFFAWLDNFRWAARFERLCIIHLGFIQRDRVMSLLRNVLK